MAERAPPGRRFLISLAPALALAAFACFQNREFQFEDGLIYQRYVRNALEGHGLVYNVGERFNGLTSPLYSFVTLAVAFAMRDAQAATAIVASLSLFAALVVFALLFSRARAPYGAAAGALLAAAHAYLYYTFGVETPLYVLLLGVSVLLFVERASTLWLGVALTLLVLTRPEGALLGVPLAVEHLREKRPLPRLSHFAVPALLLAATGAFNAWYYGSPLPSTAAAKFGQGLSGFFGPWPAFARVGYQFRWFFGGSLWLTALFVLLAVAGVWALRKSVLARVPLGFLALLTAFYLSFNSPNYHWYYGPYYAFAYFYAGAGAARLVEVGAEQLPRWVPALANSKLVVRSALAALLLAVPIAQAEIAWGILGRATNPDYLEIGRWLRVNTAPRDSIAAVEVGYLGWYSERRIVDILGLVNPLNAAFIAERDVRSWLVHYDPEYILIHDPLWSLEAGVSEVERSGRYAPDPRFSRSGFKLLRRRA
jgi:hypothetical protein